MNNQINEQDLIRKGQDMIKNGLGATFVIKWLHGKVEDKELRSRIMEQINSVNPTQNTPPKNNSEIIEQRKIRNVKYIYEDFLDSVGKLRFAGLVIFGLGVLFLLSGLATTKISIPHGIISLWIGVALYFAKDRVDWEKKTNIFIGLAVYLFLLVFEFSLFGLPDRLIPGFGETSTHKLIHITTLINDFTPALYFGLKLVFVYPFLQMLINKNKLEKTPKAIRDKLGIRNI